MGDVADDIIDGLCCQLCNTFFLEEHGYPVVCSDCWKELDKEEKKMYVRARKDLED